MSAATGRGAGVGTPAPLLLCMQAYFEAELKALYARFVAVVEGGSRDPLVHVRQRMIGQLYVMINGKPEMERAILAAMINKLGFKFQNWPKIC